MSEPAVEETETVYVLGEGGCVIQMTLPLPEAIADRLTKGYLKLVNADGSTFVETNGEQLTRPAVNAAKGIWVGWAVHNGMTPDDAEALTKLDLIDKFGQA